MRGELHQSKRRRRRDVTEVWLVGSEAAVAAAAGRVDGGGAPGAGIK